MSQVETPDFAWFNAYPQLLLERRGPGTEALIDRIESAEPGLWLLPILHDRIESAVAAYPYADRYRVWPGPNSNTFTAFLARQVPELGLDLPPTAIGKDYLIGAKILDRMPSGTGWQVSLFGLLGLGLAREEGIELNVLGLSAGIDANDLALRLPGLGRLELDPRD